MSFQKTISLHPKLAAVLDALFGLILIWWAGKIGSFWLFGLWWLVRAVWWFGLLEIMYYPPHLSRIRHFISLVVFNLGTLFFIIFIDSALARLLVTICLVLGPFVSFLLVPEKADELFVFAKPERRWQFLLNVFALAGIWSGTFALITFGVISTNLLRLFVGLAASLTTVALSWLWWREYNLSYGKNFWLSGFILDLIIFEFFYCIALWPIGYLISALLITWVWYLLWLLLRFSQTAEGINWKRQQFFLGANAALFTLFLIFIARWK